VRSRDAQAGFTLLEIIFVLAIMAILSTAILPPVLERITEAKVEGSIGQAQMILQICEIARTKVLATSVDARGRYTHTYGSLDNWASTTVLQSKLTTNYDLATKNALGSQILVKFDAARCYVAVDLPFLQSDYGGYSTETVGGKTRVIVTTRIKNSSYPSWVVNQKRILHDEETR
jgi:prepilin-type N-terminal cleavage/methylation domain-containing protein